MKDQKYSFDEKHPYYHVMNQVIDPELGIGIADMGLIYNLEVNKKGLAHVIMTFTTMACPAGPQLTTDVDAILHLQDEITDVDLEVVWNPPWTPDCIKPEIKEILFGHG